MKSLKNFHQEFEPTEALQDVIKCFWYDKINLEELESSFEVVPDGYTEIIFYFGSTLSIIQNEDLQPLSSPFIMGLLNQPAVFHTQKSFEIIGIRCYPWTIFDLLNLSSGKNGVQKFEHPITALQSLLQEYLLDGKIDDAVSLVKQYFLDTPSNNDPNIILLKAGTALNEANGIISVNSIANAAHATVRTLERKFKQSSGHTVKDVTALMRFEQVRNQLLLDPDTNIAALAHELLYTDQSHLSREFKRYSGTTPAAFARNAKKGNQFLTTITPLKK